MAETTTPTQTLAMAFVTEAAFTSPHSKLPPARARPRRIEPASIGQGAAPRSAMGSGAEGGMQPIGPSLPAPRSDSAEGSRGPSTGDGPPVSSARRPLWAAEGPPSEKVYDVGYCRPPKHTRFQPGRSGNPRGRPKGSANLHTALMRELEQVVEVTQNGRRRRMTKAQIAATQLVDAAARGDSKTIMWLVAQQADHQATVAGPPKSESTTTKPEQPVPGFLPSDLTEQECQALIAQWLAQQETYR